MYPAHPRRVYIRHQHQYQHHATRKKHHDTRKTSEGREIAGTQQQKGSFVLTRFDIIITIIAHTFDDRELPGEHVVQKIHKEPITIIA